MKFLFTFFGGVAAGLIGGFVFLRFEAKLSTALFGSVS